MPLPGIPSVQEGDDLAKLIVEALKLARLALCSGDVVIIAQKIVSKAEGRLVLLTDVEVSAEATALASEIGKDPRLVQLILNESIRIVRKRPGTPKRPGLLVVQHHRGWVHANAGIDQSNLADASGAAALLLPNDPDASAARLRDALGSYTGVFPGVIVSDSMGRPWRLGTLNVALGSAGAETLQDLRGQPDLFGRTLQTTVIGRGDELAAAAGLVMGQADEGTPVVLIRGLPPYHGKANGQDLIRANTEDLFR